ncbi:CBS domain-containing protein [Zooshikella ganghwensis]|uniref:CBS domain-containing protein n=2 Tax=Zooshikella ganghwensis TaxID=202772 RepID=A0A4P9VRH6_9GAMM|nr:CBS domain-containing protein [Zooshikella ganghwensis]
MPVLPASSTLIIKYFAYLLTFIIICHSLTSCRLPKQAKVIPFTLERTIVCRSTQNCTRHTQLLCKDRSKESILLSCHILRFQAVQSGQGKVSHIIAVNKIRNGIMSSNFTIEALRASTLPSNNSLHAQDIMTQKVLTVSEHWSLAVLASFFARHHISGAPVLNQQGKLCGVVTMTDIIRHEYIPALALFSDLLDKKSHATDDICFTHLLGNDLSEDTHLVNEIMNPDVIVISSNTSLNDIISTMIDDNVHRLFVCEQDKILGVITTMDVLKALRQQLSLFNTSVA